jgi:hypothetical protein
MALVLVLLAQTYLWILQMNYSNTPSTRMQISIHSLIIMNVGDAFLFFVFLAVAFATDATYLVALAGTFICILCCMAFGLKLLHQMWTTQYDDEDRGNRNEPAGPRIPVITPAGADVLPTPVTLATPVFMPSDQGDLVPVEQRDRGITQSLVTFRVFGPALVACFMSVGTLEWPKHVRYTYFDWLFFIYLSFCVPQLYRNVVRNCRKPLLWRVVLGQSVLRLLPILYVYTYQANVLFAPARPERALALTIWLLLQVSALFIQGSLGPRIGIPKAWLRPAYDYHPMFQDDAQRTFDCAVCMHPVEIPRARADSTGSTTLGGSILARRKYMVTPCRHVFHTKCLEAAMRQRLQCPVCRHSIPPV